MIQNKTPHVELHLIFSNQHVHTSEVGVGTFDILAIFRSSVKLLVYSERFTEKLNSALRPFRLF